MRILTLVGVALLASALTACGGSGSSDADQTSSHSSQTTHQSSLASSLPGSAAANSTAAASSVGSTSSDEVSSDGASSQSGNASSVDSSTAASSSEEGSSSSAPASDGPDFSLVGYATLTGAPDRARRQDNSPMTGVTGGEGEAPQVVAYTAANNALRDALRSGNYTGGMIFHVDSADYLADILLENDRHHRDSSYGPPYAPITIYVTGTLTPTGSTKELRIERQAHVSIIGDGDKGELNGIGIRIIDSSNIIIRNLQIHHVLAGVGAGTGIEVAYSNNIWIDRNEFFSEGLFWNENGSLNDSSKDKYDGLLDMKHGTNHVTVSWNVFRDHYKGLLLGHSDSASAAPDSITYHHNYFSRLNSRVPLIRYATTHMFNNLFEDIASSAINSRMGAHVRVENNYFENVGSGGVDSQGGYVQGPVGWWYGSSTGYWDVIDNIVISSPTDHMTSTVSTQAPVYGYEYVQQDAATARELVMQHAGRSFEPAAYPAP